MIMELPKFKKDRSPYCIFQCQKCGRWLYVKTTQKTKRCLACRRVHQVRDIEKKAFKVEGLTQAIKNVKNKENERYNQEQKAEPDLRAEGDFQITIKDKISIGPKLEKPEINKEEINYEHLFKSMLLDLSEKYPKFPGYLIPIMAQEYGIPKQEIKHLIAQFKRNEWLNCLNNNYYEIRMKE